MRSHLELHNIIRCHMVHDTGTENIDHLSDGSASGYRAADNHACLFGKYQLYFRNGRVGHSAWMGIRSLCFTNDNIHSLLLCEAFCETRDRERAAVDHG